jgi:hypothetical protein
MLADAVFWHSAVVLNSVASTGEMNTLLPGSGDDAQPLKAPPPAAAAR